MSAPSSEAERGSVELIETLQTYKHSEQLKELQSTTNNLTTD